MVFSKKHSSSKDKPPSLTAKDKVSISRLSGVGLVGSRIKVWWPLDRQFYEGLVDSYDVSRKKHTILYEDGDKEKLDLKKERWEIVEDDDSQPDEDESDDNDSPGGSPEPLSRKRAKTHGKSSVKGRDDEAVPRKRQKIDLPAKSKAKAKTEKRAVKGKDEKKENTKLQTERNGLMGDIGGKIVAAASRMSGRFQSKENGQGNERPRLLRSCKKISESNNLKQKRSSASVSKKAKKPRTSSKKIKSNNTDEVEDDKDMSDADEPTKPKQKRPSSKAVSKKVKKPRTSSKKIKASDNDDDDDDEDKVSSEADDEEKLSEAEDEEKVSEADDEEEKVSEEDDEDKVSEADDKSDDADENSDDADEMSDDDSKPLVSLLKKSPAVMDALKKKQKGKKEKEEKEEAGEGSSGNETEAVEEES